PFLRAESITSAKLTLELNPKVGAATDTTGIEGLRYIISPEITNLPLFEVSRVTINLLDTYSSEEFLGALQGGEFGKFRMYYDDDAIVSFAKLELTGEISQEFQIDLERDLGLVDEPIQVSEEVWFLGQGVNPNDLRVVKPTNLIAADTTNTDQIQPGGQLGLNLTGAGLTVGVWEAIENSTNSWRVRDTHEQLNGRVTLVDAGTSFSDHATHVAGTIAANGTGNLAARGMASQINLRRYSSANDIAELGEDAGLIVASNHSYSNSRGWNVARQQRLVNGATVNNIDVWLGDYSILFSEDVNFGKYNVNSQDLDRVLFENPNLLSVWSAGNDRDDQF
ncbi:MAG: S8 family serine peptidase, partial [Cyanobacteria bacterium J06649_11]